MAPLLGAMWPGTGGARMIVLKLHIIEYEPVPAAFFALVLQKYLAPFASPAMALDVSTTVESLRSTPLTKFESDASRTR